MPANGHARLSPSDASRWMQCPGAINRVAALGLKEDRSSRFAAEGTAAHQVREWCLEFGFDAHDFLGTVIAADGFTFEVDDEMANHLQPGIDRAREFDGEMFVEMRVDTTPWVGKDEAGQSQFGTLDCGIVGPDEIVINDLKFGMGIPVPAVNNRQLRIYALAFWNSHCRGRTDAERIRIMIDQPRNSAGGGEWVIRLDELLAFGEEVKAAAKATRDPKAPCVPSESACLWCDASKIDGACPEFERWQLDFLGLDFDDLDADEELTLPDIEGITPARRRKINHHASGIKKWLDRLHADEIAEVLEKGPRNGVKAVAGRRPPRKHADDEASEAWLRRRKLSDEQIFTRKLISPAGVDKLFGRGVFPQSLVDQGDPKPVLVPEEDDRPAIIRKDEFENFEDDDLF